LGLVLGEERLGVRDNFFEHGGHSLLAARAAARLRDAFGADVTVRDLFEFPTVEQLAARVEELLGAGDALPALVAADRERVLPLSLNQQRLWFLEQMHPRSPLYVMTAAFSFAADADAEGLRWSLQQIVRRQ